MSAKAPVRNKGIRNQIQDGDLAAFWCGRQLSQRFSFKKSTYQRNEKGIDVETLPPNDSAKFTRDPAIGPGYWYTTTDAEEIRDLDALAPKSRGAVKFVRVKDLLNFRPPYEPIELKRAIHPDL